MYTVAIIEDCEYTGSILCRYLADHQVERLTRNRVLDGIKTASSAAGAPSLLLAYGLPCSLALAESGLGRTCLVSGGQL